MKIVSNKLTRLLTKMLPKFCRVLLAAVILIWGIPLDIFPDSNSSIQENPYIRMITPNLQKIAERYSIILSEGGYEINIENSNFSRTFSISYLDDENYPEIFLDGKVYLNQNLFASFKPWFYIFGKVKREGENGDDLGLIENSLTVTETITRFDGVSRDVKLYENSDVDNTYTVRLDDDADGDIDNLHLSEDGGNEYINAFKTILTELGMENVNNINFFVTDPAREIRSFPNNFHIEELDYNLVPNGRFTNIEWIQTDGEYKFTASARYTNIGNDAPQESTFTIVSDYTPPAVTITEINGELVSDGAVILENSKYIESIRGTIYDESLNEDYDLDLDGDGIVDSPEYNEIIRKLINENHFVFMKKLHPDSSTWDVDIKSYGNYTVELTKGDTTLPSPERERTIEFELRRENNSDTPEMLLVDPDNEDDRYQETVFCIVVLDKALNQSAESIVRVGVQITEPDLAIVEPVHTSVLYPSDLINDAEYTNGLRIAVNLASDDIKRLEIKVINANDNPDSVEPIAEWPNPELDFVPLPTGNYEAIKSLEEEYGLYIIIAKATNGVGVEKEKTIAIYFCAEGEIPPIVVAAAWGPSEVEDHTIDITKNKIKVEGYDSIAFNTVNVDPNAGLVYSWTIDEKDPPDAPDGEIENYGTGQPIVYLPHIEELVIYTIKLAVTYVENPVAIAEDTVITEVVNNPPAVKITDENGLERPSFNVGQGVTLKLRGIANDPNNDDLTNYIWDISPNTGWTKIDNGMVSEDIWEVEITFQEVRDDYIITLTMTDDHGLSSSRSVNVNVRVTPPIEIVYPNPEVLIYSFDSLFSEALNNLIATLADILPNGIPDLSLTTIYIGGKLYLNNAVITAIQQYFYILGHIDDPSDREVSVYERIFNGFYGDVQPESPDSSFQFICFDTNIIGVIATAVMNSGLIPDFVKGVLLTVINLDLGINFIALSDGSLANMKRFNDLNLLDDGTIEFIAKDDQDRVSDPVTIIKDTVPPIVRIETIADDVTNPIHDVGAALLEKPYVDINSDSIYEITGTIDDCTIDTADIHKDDYHFILTRVPFPQDGDKFVREDSRSISLSDINGDGVIEFSVRSNNADPLIVLEDPLQTHEICINVLDKALNPTDPDPLAGRYIVPVKDNRLPEAIAEVMQDGITNHSDSSPVILVGERSNDPNGDILLIDWKLKQARDPNGTTVDISEELTFTVRGRYVKNWEFSVHEALNFLSLVEPNKFSFILDGQSVGLVFELTVTEELLYGVGESDTARVTVNILNNAPDVEITGAPAGPIVIAGSPVMVPLSSLVGDSNYDETFSYSWSIVNPSSGVEFEGDTNNNNCIVKITEAGSYRVKLEVTDEHNATGSNEIVIEAISGNRPPTADAGTDQSGITDHETPVTLDGSGSSDPDPDDTLTYSWELSNANVDTDGDGTYDDTNVPLEFTFSDTDQNPSFDVHDVLDDRTLLNGGSVLLEFTLTVTDSHGERAVDNVQVSIINNAPVVFIGRDYGDGNGPVPIDADGDGVELVEVPDDGLTFRVYGFASDPNEDYLPIIDLFPWNEATDGGQYDQIYDPDNNYYYVEILLHPGETWRAELYAQDEHYCSSLVGVEIHAIAGNHPPELAQIGNKIVDEGELLTFTINAIDPDGDTLTYSAENLPSGATLTDNADGTATFNWTPTSGQSDNYTVTFVVTDNGTPNLSDSEGIIITVEPSGITLQATPTIVVEGKTYYSVYPVENHTPPFRTITLDGSKSITDPNKDYTYEWTYSGVYVDDGTEFINVTDPIYGNEVSHEIPHLERLARYTYTLTVTEVGTSNFHSADIVAEVQNSEPSAQVTIREYNDSNQPETEIDTSEPVLIEKWETKHLNVYGRMSDPNSEERLDYTWTKHDGTTSGGSGIMTLSYNAYIIFDYRDNKNFKYAGISKDNYLSIGERRGGTFISLDDIYLRGENFICDKYYYIKIECNHDNDSALPVVSILDERGNTVLKTDGQLVNPTSYRGGYIGLYTKDAKAVFKDLKVYNGTEPVSIPNEEWPIIYGEWSYDEATGEWTGHVGRGDAAVINSPLEISEDNMESGNIIIEATLKLSEFPERSRENWFSWYISRPPEKQDYNVEFEVKDRHGGSSSSTVTVQVIPEPEALIEVTPVEMPIIKFDQIVTLDGENSIPLSGIHYAWSLGSVSINGTSNGDLKVPISDRIFVSNNPINSSISFNAKDIINVIDGQNIELPGEAIIDLAFNLIVGDDYGNFNTATKIISIKNKAPSLDTLNYSVDNKTVNLHCEGIDENDPDNTGYEELDYSWLLAVPEGSESVIVVDESDSSSASFTADVPGTYTLSVTAADKHGAVSDRRSLWFDATSESIGEQTLFISYIAAIPNNVEDHSAQITLAGTGGSATNPTGDGLEYVWSLVSATKLVSATGDEIDILSIINFSPRYSNSCTFTAHDLLENIPMNNGDTVILIFALTVTDPVTNLSVAEQVTVSIVNNAPVITYMGDDIVESIDGVNVVVTCVVQDINGGEEDLVFEWTITDPEGNEPETVFVNTTSTVSSVTFPARTAGMYDIKVEVKDRHGASVNGSTSIPVNPEGDDGPPDGQNRPPIAVLATHCISGKAPLAVFLDGTASYDPDKGDRIASYEWTVRRTIIYGQDSQAKEEELVVGADDTLEIEFITAGNYLITLKVTDTQGAIGEAHIGIHVMDGADTNDGPNDGNDGNNGRDGTNGTDGNNGRDGTGGNNESGEYNESGTTRSRTAKNTAGSDGEDGRDGADGNNGLSGGAVPIIMRYDVEPSLPPSAVKPDDGPYGKINVIRTHTGRELWELWKGIESIKDESGEDKSYKRGSERELETLRDEIKRITDSLERGGEIYKEDNVGYAMLDNRTKKEINNINEFYPKEKETITRLAMNTSTTENSKDSPAPEQEGNDKSEKSSFPFKDFVKKIVLALIMLFIYPFMHKKFL